LRLGYAKRPLTHLQNQFEKNFALTLQNTWFASTALSLEFTEKYTAGRLLYDQQALAGGDAHQEGMMVFCFTRIIRNRL
jgi:hypothetical protein